MLETGVGARDGYASTSIERQYSICVWFIVGSQRSHCQLHREGNIGFLT